MTTCELPTGRFVLILLGLCRQGQVLSPVDDQPDADGRLWFRWSGLRGGAGIIGIDHDNAEDMATLAYLSSSSRSYVELLAVLTMARALAGAEHQWCGERIASLLYGPHTPSAHRERQLPTISAIVGLLERAWVQITTDSAPQDTPGRKPAVPAQGLSGHLLAFDTASSGRRGRTVRPHADLLADLGQWFTTVPVTFFLVRDRNHHNPEGNLPSLDVKARVTLAAAIVSRWRQQAPQAIRTRELLVDFAGLDVPRVERRRHVRQWAEAVWTTLATAAAVGPGLRRKDDEAKPLLESLLLPSRGGQVLTRPAPTPPRPGQLRSKRGGQRQRARAPA